MTVQNAQRPKTAPRQLGTGGRDRGPRGRGGEGGRQRSGSNALAAKGEGIHKTLGRAVVRSVQTESAVADRLRPTDRTDGQERGLPAVFWRGGTGDLQKRREWGMREERDGRVDWANYSAEGVNHSTHTMMCACVCAYYGMAEQ